MFVTFSGIWEKPGNNYAESFSVKTTSELFQKIGNKLRGIFGDKRKIGTVSKVNDDIVFVKLSDIDVRRNMQLTGWSTYSFGPGNDGYKNSLEDFNNAINYMKKSDKDYAWQKMSQVIHCNELPRKSLFFLFSFLSHRNRSNIITPREGPTQDKHNDGS